MAFDQQVKRTINSLDVVPTINTSPQANTTGNITTSSTTIVATDLVGVGSATVQFKGTYAGVNVTFEASPDAGTTWVAVNGQQVTTGLNTASGATGVLATNATVAYNVTPLLGFDQFRVRSTAFTSGSAAVVIHTSSQFTQTSVAVVAAPTTTVTGTVATTQSTSPWITREGGAATPTTTQVTPTTTSTTLKASNAARKRLILSNEGTSDCYVAYGATSSAAAHAFIVPSGGAATIPGEEYTGIVSGVWIATGGNNMQVTETV